MRVIAGIYRSRQLHTLRGQALRPSSDRLRESLFNILGPAVKDAVFVDLFAGSGAVGIEALSRGARRAIFAEHHPAGVTLLRRNLESLGIATVKTTTKRSAAIAGASRETAAAATPTITAGITNLAAGRVTHTAEFAGGAEILALDAIAALELLDSRGSRADFVFADPPYADDRAYEDALSLLGDSDLLVPGGQAIFEHSRRRVLPALAGKLERARVTEQGDSALSIYRVAQAA